MRVLSDYNQQIYSIFLLFWIPVLLLLNSVFNRNLLLRAASVRLAANRGAKQNRTRPKHTSVRSGATCRYLDSGRVFGEVEEPLRWSVEDAPVVARHAVRAAGDDTLHHGDRRRCTARTQPNQSDGTNPTSEPRSLPSVFRVNGHNATVPFVYVPIPRSFPRTGRGVFLTRKYNKIGKVRAFFGANWPSVILLLRHLIHRSQY